MSRRPEETGDERRIGGEEKIGIAREGGEQGQGWGFQRRLEPGH